jgi:putative tryptophan/tyrosine transport system substrate-binding protein
MRRQEVQRRAFLSGFSAAAIAYTGHGWAQQTGKIVRVGVLWHAISAEQEAPFLKPFVESMAKLGYLEGHNVVFEHRFPAEQPERFKLLADELVRLDMDVIVASAPNAAFAAKAATKTIPIVFVVVPDPVETGLVDGLARPGGNITGFALVDVSPKRLEVFKEAFSRLSQVALLVNRDNRVSSERFIQSMQAASADLKLGVQTVEVAGPQDFERAFSEVQADKGAGAVLAFDSMFIANRARIAQFAITHRVPVMAASELYVKDGVFIAYSPDTIDLFRRAAGYVDKILKGTKAADLPVEQPSKYNLTINLKTARTIGLDVSATLLANADEVIE